MRGRTFYRLKAKTSTALDYFSIDFRPRDSIGILPIFQCIFANKLDLSQTMLVLMSLFASPFAFKFERHNTHAAFCRVQLIKLRVIKIPLHHFIRIFTII